MRCRIGVVSIGLLRKYLHNTVVAMDLPADFIFSDKLMQGVDRLPQELEKVDVILSSGYNANILKRLTSKPVVTIEPSIYDLLAAYSEAIAYDPEPVVIFPFKQNSLRIDKIQNILSVNIVPKWYYEVDNVDLMIRTYAARGCKCVIGSGLVCDKAARYGIKGIFIYPEESLRSYIEIAYDMALSICNEVEKNQRMRSVIDNSKSAIIFTDERGMISICNSKAQNIFNASAATIIGTHIGNYFDMEKLRPAYEQDTPVNNLIRLFGEEKYIVQARPVFQKEVLCNVMISLDNIKTIQSQEYHIRSSLAQKGFVARYRFEDLKSDSPAFNEMVWAAKKFSRSDDNIVLFGETGVGKEVIAQSIHNHSQRNADPFVAVNCSAISEHLLESELFGYDEGAFTGARKGGKQGLFEMAHNGTIFLDEIGELSTQLQSKLLRVLQEKQVIHIGGSKVIYFDARVIAATNRNLWEQVRVKEFREDLYYRLTVLELNIPPLRARQEDIYRLFLSFVGRQQPMYAANLDEYRSVLEPILCSYSWPGNIRELENFTKMILAIMSEDESVEVFLRRVQKEVAQRKNKFSPSNLPLEYESVAIPGPCNQEDEYDKILKAISATGGNHTRAAELLGISRVTLWRRLKTIKAAGSE